jgi:phosphoglycolate phosphatase
MKGSRLLIFDLDGTLVDSKQDLVNAVNATRTFMGEGPIPVPQISSYVGNGAHVLVQRALPEVSGPDFERAFRYFLDYYRQHMLDHTAAYPGVREALDQFHAADIAMAVLTNKPVRFSVSMIEGLGLDLHFFRIYGGNSFEQKKPHPAGVYALMAESGIAAERTVIVGDSAIDVLTARNAGVYSCGVPWGIQPETFLHVPPDVMVQDLRDLVPLILGA